MESFFRSYLSLSHSEKFPYIMQPKGCSRPPLCSSGQSSWLQIQRSGFDSRHYQIFWEVVGLERSPLSLVSTIEKLLVRESSGSGLEKREYNHRDPSHWPCGNLYLQKLSGGRLVVIVRSRTQTIVLLVVHNSPPSDIMSHMNEVYILHPVSLIPILIHVNLPSIPRSSKWPCIYSKKFYRGIW
jgi:hypothetical protein